MAPESLLSWPASPVHFTTAQAALKHLIERIRITRSQIFLSKVPRRSLWHICMYDTRFSTMPGENHPEFRQALALDGNHDGSFLVDGTIIGREFIATWSFAESSELYLTRRRASRDPTVAYSKKLNRQVMRRQSRIQLVESLVGRTATSTTNSIRSIDSRS
jgi:hypothetical protein